MYKYSLTTYWETEYYTFDDLLSHEKGEKEEEITYNWSTSTVFDVDTMEKYDFKVGEYEKDIYKDSNSGFAYD